MQIHFVIRRKIEDRRRADKEGLLGGGHTQEAGSSGREKETCARTSVNMSTTGWGVYKDRRCESCV